MVAPRPPLRIVVLFHPASMAGRDLALGVYRRFAGSSGSPGLRIPVAFAPERAGDLPPDEIVVDAAAHTLVVALIDGRMAQRARPVDDVSADAWAKLILKLTAQTPTNLQHGFLPVAVDGGAFGLAEALAHRSFVRLDRFDSDPGKKRDELAFHVAGAALKLLEGRTLPSEPTTRAPIQLFVSHAKADLPRSPISTAEGPALEVIATLAQGPVDGWYDARNIPSGKRFDEAIKEGVIKCDVFVCIVTDSYSDREWCRREALLAKRAGIPMVVVDALSSEIPRLFPYVGNTRTLRWEPGRSGAVVLAAVVEALRHRHAVAVLSLRTRPGEVIFGVPPETLTLLRVPAETRRVVYPDPPLPIEEVEELMPALMRGAGPLEEAASGEVAVTLTTPLSEVARWRHPSQLDLIGLSLSGATDIAAWGASAEHLRTLANDLVTMLLVAGVRLAYGGVLAHGGVQGDEVNYTTELFGCVRSYSPLMQHLGPNRVRPIVNFVPWPTHLGYGEDDLAVYGQEAKLEAGPAPTMDPAVLARVAVDGRGFFPREPGIRAWAYAQGTTEMRQEMAKRISARVALAGKMEGFGGLLPGVLEEAYIARFGARPVPLYLIGAFGGAARLAIDVLEQRHRAEASTQWLMAHVGGYGRLVEEYGRNGGPVVMIEDVVAKLRALGVKGPAQALDNGLDDEENRELFEATDSFRVVELILIGLRRRFPEPP